MAKAQASLGVTVAVFGFDPSPDTASNRALHVLSVRQGLPKAELDARETFEAAGDAGGGGGRDPARGGPQGRVAVSTSSGSTTRRAPAAPGR